MATATAIDESNGLHCSLGGMFAWCDRDIVTMTPYLKGLHGYQRECSHEKQFCRRDSCNVWMDFSPQKPVRLANVLARTISDNSIFQNATDYTLPPK